MKGDSAGIVVAAATEVARFVDLASQTVQRAARLTQRLLAFARRQILQPEPVNTDALIESMAELIQRTVGPGVRLELSR